jgi:hydroxymethylglutaryl-CoA lyase
MDGVTEMKNQVTICEVGLRDGLQSEKIAISVLDRIKLAKKLVQAGLPRVELGSFVRADWVPQMAGTRDIVMAMNHWAKRVHSKVAFPVLVPNLRGLEDAIESGVKEIAIFASVTECFSKANLNASKAEAKKRFSEVTREALKRKIKVRGYLSVCFGCPFEGEVKIKDVVKSASELVELGCYEVSIGDTIGVAHAAQVAKTFQALSKIQDISYFAGHFHDTRGQALTNVLMAYQQGVRVFDSSFGGLGGCPYAPASTGNVATEELIYLFDGMGVKTGVDIEKLMQVGKDLAVIIQRPLPSRLHRAGLFKQKLARKRAAKV